MIVPVNISTPPALREIFSEYIAEAKREVVEEQGDIFFNKDGKTLNEALEEANEMKMQTMIEASLAEHNADKANHDDTK